MRALVQLAGLMLAFPVAAGAAEVLINNGLDCSNPGNVIDHATYESDTVLVRNVGCGTPDPGSPCPSPGDATEVCVELGGEVYELYAEDSSSVTMNGGTVGRLGGEDSSIVTMNGGTVGYGLDAYDSSTVAINSGATTSGIWAAGLAKVAMDGGTVNDYVYLFDFSTFAMDGGNIGGYLSAWNSATFTMSGGQLESVQAADSSSFTLKDGTVGQDLDAEGSSTVTISGGTVGFPIWAAGSSTVTINGGTVGGLLAFDASTITMRGGASEGGLGAVDSSTIAIAGTRFAVDGSPVPHGDLTAQRGTLTGRLASGDPIDNWFNQGGGDYTGTITLAPPGYLVVPALSLSGKLLLAAVLLGSAATRMRRPRSS